MHLIHGGSALKWYLTASLADGDVSARTDYMDISADGFVGGEEIHTSNTVGANLMLSTPAAGIVRVIKSFTIYCSAAAGGTVIVYFDDGTNNSSLRRLTLVQNIAANWFEAVGWEQP